MAVNTVWGPHFATGIEIIDQQHQRIFSYLKEVDTAIRDRNEAKVQEIARALIDYAVSHNSFEETLMENADYPLLPAHRKVHEHFRERAYGYVHKLDAGAEPFALARTIRSDIGLWLTNHIQRDDQDYVPFVKKKLEQGFVSRMLKKFFP